MRTISVQRLERSKATDRHPITFNFFYFLVFLGEKVTMFVTEVLKPESKHLLCHTCPFSTKDQEAMDLHLLTYHKAKAKDSENFNFKKVSAF